MDIKKTIANVKSKGFLVYAPANLSTYFYYTDGVNIAYAQVANRESYITTVHKANTSTGTGFRMCDIVSEDITREELLLGFSFYPQWAMGEQAKSVKKYSSMDDFTKGNWEKLLQY